MEASKAYVEALTKIAKHAQQGTWGGCADIGAALLQLVDVQKEMEAQQLQILKAFYVDLLVPLESNIEKDAKVVAAEQKRVLQQHKQQFEAFQKVSAIVKKQRKRSTRKPNIEKEFRNMQAFDDEKRLLDELCRTTLKQAITQERRRFGFVLERQCSLAKHQITHYANGKNFIQSNLDKWLEIVNTRETLPESLLQAIETPTEIKINRDYTGTLTSEASDFSRNSAMMRRSRSNDASCMDLRSLSDHNELDLEFPSGPIIRARSYLNIASSRTSLVSLSEFGENNNDATKTNGENGNNGNINETKRVRALYSYLASGEHQLNFHEDDVILLLGERSKGWHYGENTRTRRQGWFPVSYTEPDDGPSRQARQRSGSDASSTNTPAQSSCSSESSSGGCNHPTKPPFPEIPSLFPPFPRRPLSTFFDSALLKTTFTQAIIHRCADDCDPRGGRRGGRGGNPDTDPVSDNPDPSSAATTPTPGNAGKVLATPETGTPARCRGSNQSTSGPTPVPDRSSVVSTISQRPPTRSLTSPGPLIVTPLPPLKSLALFSSSLSDRDSAYSTSSGGSSSGNNDSISTVSSSTSSQQVTPVPPPISADNNPDENVTPCVNTDIANRFSCARSSSVEKTDM